MEKSITNFTDSYITKFKTDIQRKTIQLDFQEKEKINELLEYMFEYERLALPKDLFLKKSKTNLSGSSSSSSIGRQPPPIPTPPICDEERCVAMRKQGDRCTRKKTKGNMYCGTHCIKNSQQGQGHGIPVESNGMTVLDGGNTVPTPPPLTRNLEVIAQEIQGIIYYMDKELNVYNTEDIFKNLNNPRIIAKAVQLGNRVYSIPSLGL
jgi:hypothetical protein